MSQETEVAKQTREMGDWSKLPEELLPFIGVRVFSNIELKRFRSICTSWRSSISGTNNNLFPSYPRINFKPLVVNVAIILGQERLSGLNNRTYLSRAAFFRVTLSSSPDQGWLIKSETNLLNSKKLHLLNPLSRLALPHSTKSINLLEFTVSEIQEAFSVLYGHKKETAPGFKRVVPVTVPGGDHRVLVIASDGKIRYWNGEMWKRVKDQVAQYSDIILHKGLTYALDTQGIVWWISSSYEISRYGPPIHDNNTNGYGRDKRFVECCGVLYTVGEVNVPKRNAASLFDVDDPSQHFRGIHDDVGNVIFESEGVSPKTVGFKVYKMDEELVEWVEVKSLGEYAFVMATDTCFSVLARDFYGCLPNSIYFTDKEEEFKVFKLDDGSIATMSVSEQSCFQMFAPSFL